MSTDCTTTWTINRKSHVSAVWKHSVQMCVYGLSKKQKTPFNSPKYVGAQLNYIIEIDSIAIFMLLQMFWAWPWLRKKSRQGFIQYICRVIFKNFYQWNITSCLIHWYTDIGVECLLSYVFRGSICIRLSIQIFVCLEWSVSYDW